MPSGEGLSCVNCAWNGCCTLGHVVPCQLIKAASSGTVLFVSATVVAFVGGTGWSFNCGCLSVAVLQLAYYLKKKCHLPEDRSVSKTEFPHHTCVSFKRPSSVTFPKSNSPVEVTPGPAEFTSQPGFLLCPSNCQT
ncbi:hypothetical protein Bbelb_230780 [Branchiostoma belcheri]|nr:hypothetical protein Bbelb_230780 [Branchiostoma belcheri]